MLERSCCSRSLILYDGAERIGKGDLSHRIDLSTNDEIQELAQSFNVMAGGLEQSHKELESRIKERTVQLSNSVIDVRDKARKLYEYGRDLATISRFSRKVFNAEQTLAKLLDQCMWAVSRGLGYNKALLFIVDRKRALLKLKRDSGLGELLYIPDQSLAGQEPFAGLVRAGRYMYVEDTGSDPVFNRYRSQAFPELPALHVIPVLSGTRNNKCWDILGCFKTDCPAYARHDLSCWMVENTLCRNSLVESYGDKLAYCMSCQIFPVLGVLVVGARPVRGFPKRDISVLRILAAQMGAALENHRLYDANRQMVRDLLELHKATASALAELSLDRALEAFAGSAVKLSGQDACNFWLLSKDGRELVRKAGICSAAGIDTSSFPERVPVDAGVLAASYRRNSVVTDYRMANDGTRLGEVLAAHGLVSLLAVPLTSEGRSIGVLSIHKKSSTPFIESEIAAFLLVANHAALAVNVCILNEEMKNRNRELSSNISLIEGLLASISSGVMLVDKKGTVQLINQAGAALLNMRPGDMMQQPLADLFPEAAAFFDSSIGPYQETEILLADGTKVPIGFSNTYYRGSSGEDEGVIILYRDLTEIKSLRAEVLTKERFAAMGRVVDGVAHEIRNPLFGISSIGQIFERELRDPGHQKLAGALISETKRLNRLVEELLIYGRPMKLQLTKCDVIGLWEEAIQMNREEMEGKGISLWGESGVLHIHAYLDAHQMKQVFLNLIRNAIDSMPAGGEISTTLLLEDRYIIFTIADTGEGIPAGDMEKVFDLFFTTKPKGTGLGLGICKKIIEDHGGEISIRRRQEIQTEKKTGTAVILKLPYKGRVERGTLQRGA